MSSEDDIETLKARIAEHEKTISRHEQDKIDHSTGHKLLISIIVLVLGGIALYFSGYWPTVVKLYYRVVQQAMESLGQVKNALQDLSKL